VFLPISPDQWYPEQRTRHVSSRCLKAEEIIVLEGKPFRVDRIDEVPAERWPTRFVELWHRQGMPDADVWDYRPVDLSGHWQGPNADTRAYGVTVSACHIWHVLDEHYSVCNQCFEIPPCRHVHNEVIVARAAARMAEDMELRPGLCHACREPITDRQKSVAFPGPNLIRPDLPEGTAAFHTRARCSDGLEAYARRAGHPAVATDSQPRPGTDHLF